MIVSECKPFEQKLGLPPLPELTEVGLSVVDKKRKRTFEMIKKVFVKENIRVDGMDRDLIPPPGVVAIKGKVITEPELSEEMFQRLQLTIKARNDVEQARIIIRDNLDDGAIPVDCKASEGNEDPLSAMHQLVIKGLADGKALASNLKDIQVKDIVKEVEDYLKTYSSAEMDIRWYVEGIL
ncbi:hypothetical protein Tco_0331527 [Tanacetum coccineum]